MIGFILVICLIPIIFPMYKLYRKQEINAFDVLVLSHTFFFVIIPITHLDDIQDCNTSTVLKLALVYLSFIGLSLLFSHIYGRRQSSSIVIITKVLSQQAADVRLNVWGQCVVFIGLLATLLFYLPEEALVLRFEENGIHAVKTYSQSVTFAILSRVYFNLSFIIVLVLVSEVFNRRVNAVNIALFTFFCIIALLGVRRELIFRVLIVAIIVYSAHRNDITFKSVGIVSIVIALIISFYFPFYNIIRRSPIIFQGDKPIESIVKIVDYGIDNYDSKIDEAAESTDSRSLGLFRAAYSMLYRNPDCHYGELTLLFIDNGIPKVINPNKGEGASRIIEKETGANVDLADSVLLTGIGDFGLFGGVYAAFFFLIMFGLYNLYCAFFTRLFPSKLIPLYAVFSVLSFCWEVEELPTGFFSWFFSSCIVVVLLYALERLGFIRFCSSISLQKH